MGITLLLIYVIGSTFVPGSETALLGVALPGGILSMVWNVLVARKLFRLRRSRPDAS